MSNNNVEDTQEISKNAKKRQLAKDIWKLRNDNKKKLKTSSSSDNNGKNDNNNNNNNSIGTENIKKKSKKSLEKDNKFLNKLQNAPTIVIDMDYDDKMTESEQKSLSQQIMYCYGANKRAKKPFNMFLSKLNGKTEECLKKISGFPTNWLGCNVDHECKGYEELFDKKKLIYLSADSPNILETIDNDKIYILGGIVDRNRYKNITYEKALEQKIETARFPLQQYCTINSGTHILTVNHCYDILLSRYNSDNWITTFKNGIPSRKDLKIKNEFISDDDGVHSSSSSNHVMIEDIEKKNKKKKKKKKKHTKEPSILSNSKLVVIVGGSNGIGYGFASFFYNKNNDVVASYTILLVGRNVERLNDAKRKLMASSTDNNNNNNNNNNSIYTFQCDCMEKAECYMLRDYIRTTFGKKRGTISILVNSAGNFLWDKDVPKNENPNEYLENANFNTKKHVCEALIPLMLPDNYQPLLSQKGDETTSKRPPHIILIGSQAGKPNFKEEIEMKEGKGATDGETGYIYAMANLHQWALKMKTSMEQKGIMLNLLEPGLVNTNLARNNFHHFGIDWNTIITPIQYAEEEMNKILF